MKDKKDKTLYERVGYGAGRVFYCEAHSNLEGQILTIIDSLGLKDTQEKATKDLIRQTIWRFIGDASCWVEPKDHTELRIKDRERDKTIPSSTPR